MNLLSKLDSFKNNQKIISYDQTTNDIINAILKQHNKSERDYDKLFYFFDCGNYYDTAKKVFNFLKKNIHYQIEPDELQTVKTPAAILATKNGDCKHMSLFIAGILMVVCIIVQRLWCFSWYQLKLRQILSFL